MCQINRTTKKCTRIGRIVIRLMVMIIISRYNACTMEFIKDSMLSLMQ